MKKTRQVEMTKEEKRKAYLKEYQKRYYSDPVNRAKKKAYMEQWTLDNKERLLKQWREYHHQNKEKRNAYCR